MTADQMGYRFEIGFNIVDTSSGPGYTDKEKSLILTEAAEELVLKKINPKGNKNQEGFEESEIRRKNLSELIKSTTPTASSGSTGVHINGAFYDLPSDFWLAISEQVTVSYAGVNGATGTYTLDVNPITHDEYNINRKNPYKKPYVDESNGFVWRLDFSSIDSTQVVELIKPTGCTITAYNIRYLKKVEPIVMTDVTLEGVAGPQNCELHASTHPEVVKFAIKLADAKIKDTQAYQIHNAEAINAE